MPDDMESSGSQSEYTAVVYFHGMGEQRKYEELSRLIDSLDAYPSSGATSEGDGCLRRIRARLEAPRGLLDRDASYVQVRHLPAQDSSSITGGNFRFYELYWAPVTAGGSGAWSVVRWLLRQILTPLSVLKAPWRERQRLRRASLHSLWESCREKGYGEFEPSDFARLMSEYYRFEGTVARREYPKGRYTDFREYLKKADPDSQYTGRLRRLTGSWFRRYLYNESVAAAVLFTIGLVMVIGVVGVIFLLAAGVGAFYVNSPEVCATLSEAPLGDLLIRGMQFGNTHLLTVTAAILLVFCVAFLLRKYLGDVQIWCTYQETDTKHRKRREILDRGVRLMTHVLADPHCTRVVVVAHSLGTAIAVDTLLQLGRYNRARNASAPLLGPLELEKLDHVVTLGSPIDKIHYFFESRTGRLHRYNRIVEEIRGDLGTVPFVKNRKPHIHWVNFWDAADVISGPLETQSSPKNPWLRVDNVRIASSFFPNPLTSHAAYFRDRSVVGTLFRIIFKGEGSLRTFKFSAKKSEELDGQFFGPGRSSGFPRFVQAVGLAVPWIFAGGIGARFIGAPAWVASSILHLAVILVVCLALGLSATWIRDSIVRHRH